MVNDFIKEATLTPENWGDELFNKIKMLGIFSSEDWKGDLQKECKDAGLQFGLINLVNAYNAWKMGKSYEKIRESSRDWVKSKRDHADRGNILKFQKISMKSGEPYEILDNAIAEHITQQQLTLFVLNGLPYIYDHGCYHRDEDGKLLKGYIKELIWPELVTIGRINRVYSLILADYRLTKKNEEINQYPAQWINFRNGMYDPVLQVMHPHKPEYYSINQVPHEYDPGAEYHGTVAEKFYKGIFPDPQDREMYFAYCGYCMTIDTSLQKFMTLIGAPGSGKSTALNMQVEALGSENVCSITIQDLNERFTPTELLGKLLNACADLPKKALDQVDAIKRITGEDLVKGEYKGGKVFSFRSYAKLIFSANEMPVNLDEKSDAFYRRMLFIEIPKKGEHIPNLKEGLARSMPGYIHECVAALTRLYTSGREIDSTNSKKLVHEYHRESDTSLSFLDDCIRREPGARIERKKLYEHYKAYCYANEWAPLSAKSFNRALRGKGYCEGKISGVWYFKDIRHFSHVMFTTYAPNGAGNETGGAEGAEIDHTPEGQANKDVCRSGAEKR